MKTQYLKEAYYNTSRESLLNLIEFCTELGGKKFKENQICNYITKVIWSENETDVLFRVNMQVASVYLEYILENTTVEFNINYIKTIITDIADLMRENLVKEDLDWFIQSTNIISSSIHLKHAKELFYNKELKELNYCKHHLDLLSIFAMRLALEKRILGILNIDYLIVNNKPIGLSRFIKIVKELENIEFSKEVNWDYILKSNKWLNHYIHRQIRPNPWAIFKIFSYLEKLLGKGEFTDDKFLYKSLYYSTRVKDEKTLSQEIEKKINEIPGEKEIAWRNGREVLKINSD